MDSKTMLGSLLGFLSENHRLGVVHLLTVLIDQMRIEMFHRTAAHAESALHARAAFDHFLTDPELGHFRLLN